MRTVDGHLDQTGTGFTRDFHLSDLFLHLLHFFLHLLSLLHQATQTAFSTKHRLLSSFTFKDYNRKSDSRSNGANTLFIQIGVEEPAQGLNVVIRNNRLARLREFLFINGLAPLKRRFHCRIIIFNDSQFNRRTL